MIRARSAEVSVEVAGTPEEAWDAIATGPGITAWFVPAEVEEREGGAVSLDVGTGMGPAGTVTDGTRRAGSPTRRPGRRSTASRRDGSRPSSTSRPTAAARASCGS